MKKKLPTILLVLVLLIGIGVMAYPTVSQQINKLHASQAVSTYDKAVEQISEADDSALWEEARAYNETITQNDFSYDVFSGSEKELRDTPYWNVLNIEGNGLMGYVSVPKINEKIPTGYQCDCSRERIDKALISLGKKELEDMIHDGETIEVGCQFCNKKYPVTVEELKSLLARSRR